MQGELYGISKEDYARFRAAPALEAYAEIERMTEGGELYKIYTAIELASRRTWPRDFHDMLAWLLLPHVNSSGYRFALTAFVRFMSVEKRFYAVRHITREDAKARHFARYYFPAIVRQRYGDKYCGLWTRWDEQPHNGPRENDRAEMH